MLGLCVGLLRGAHAYLAWVRLLGSDEPTIWRGRSAALKIRVLADVAAAMAFLHSSGILHLRLKVCIGA